MKKTLITGITSGIGKAIAKELIESGYSLYGISRKKLEDSEHSTYLQCDLSDEKATEAMLKKIGNIDFDVLVNSAGFGVFAPHETIDAKKISSLINVNLKAPILLTSELLRGLKKQKGMIINIASVEATRHSRFSALYTASKAGLRAFSLSLFEEVRKSGVGVVNINPDMCDTPFFDTLDFEPNREGQNCIDPKALAKYVRFLLENKDSFIATDVTFRTQGLDIIKKPTLSKIRAK